MSRTYRDRKYTFQEYFGNIALLNDEFFVGKLLTRYYKDNNFLWKTYQKRKIKYFKEPCVLLKYSKRIEKYNHKNEVFDAIELLNDLSEDFKNDTMFYHNKFENFIRLEEVYDRVKLHLHYILQINDPVKSAYSLGYVIGFNAVELGSEIKFTNNYNLEQFVFLEFEYTQTQLHTQHISDITEQIKMSFMYGYVDGYNYFEYDEWGVSYAK